MRSNRNYLALLIAVVLATPLQAAGAGSADYVHRDLVVEAALCAYVPGQGIEAYDGHGSGMSTARGSLGLGVEINGTSVSAKIAPRVKDGRFFVVVDIEPEDAKKSLGFEKQTLDVTDLKPTALRLGTDERGRVFQLNLTPSVRVTDNTPRPLNVSELRLQNWRFPDSPILVNDALYVGRVSCAQSPVAFVDISGVARVEFSLYQLTDAKPWGELNHGVVTLTNPDDHTTIQISNVSNGGPYAMELPGGPYRVWVRWSKPSRTVEQHRQELAELRKKIADGEVPNARTDSLDKQLARDPSPWVYSSGVRGLLAGEQAGETE